MRFGFVEETRLIGARCEGIQLLKRRACGRRIGWRAIGIRQSINEKLRGERKREIRSNKIREN